MAQPAQANRADGASYMPALDGMRAVSIMLVILSHLGLARVVPGAFGVTLFFFISGYLITRQLMNSLNAVGRIGLIGFYLRRALRLVPASFVYILIAGLAYQAVGGRLGFWAWAWALLYGANFYDLWAGYVSTVPGVRHPFNILWSLAIEEHFYLIWPILLGLGWQWRGLFWAVLGFCALVLTWRWILFDTCFLDHASLVCAPLRPNPLWRGNQLYLGTDTRADSIAWGALLAIGESRFPSLAGRPASPFPVGLAVCALIAGFQIPSDFARFVIRTSLQGAALMILMPALLHHNTVVRRALSCAPALALGRLSYSLYLWHWGALGAADWIAGRNFPAWLALAISLSACLAALSYLGIERPMLRLRRRAGSHAPAQLTGL